MKTRLLIVDDTQKVRTGLRTILDLQDDIEVVGEASNGAEAVVLAWKLKPDIVLMDIAMPDMDGVKATRLIKSQYQPPEIIILTVHGEEALRRSVAEAGADAYIEKSEGIDKVIETIHWQAASRRDAG